MKKKNGKKGFSLVELIIVIAIMVALVAVMAPNFVKYVEKARNAAILYAAEDVVAIAKSEYAQGNLKGSGVIKIYAGDDGIVHVSLLQDAAFSGKTPLSYSSTETNDFEQVCGLDSNRKCNSDLVYIITVDGTIISHPTFEEESTVENGDE